MSRPSPISSRICAGATFALASWTVLCNLAVIAGSSLHDLLGTAAGTSLVAAMGWVWWRRRRRETSPQAQVSASPSVGLAAPPSKGGPDDFRLTLTFVVLAAGVAAIHAWRRDVVLLWWMVMAVLGLAWWIETRRSAGTEAPAQSRGREIALWATALGGALLALIANRPSADDALVVNLAVTVADHPGIPLLRDDGIFGIAGMPIQFPMYRVQSIEILAGALSALTRIPAIYVMHSLLPPIAGFLTVLAYAELFRKLVPRQWLWATIGVVIVLVSMGNDWPSFGFAAFARFQAPKSLCVSFAIPLLMSYALAFAQLPSRGNWLRLVAVQIAAVGMTSSALMTVPVLLLITLLVASGFDRRSVSTFLIGLASSGYLLLLAIFWLPAMRSAVDAMDAPAGYEIAVTSNSAAVEMMLKVALGSGSALVFTTALLLFAWTLPRGRLPRRFLILVPMAWFFVFANPFWARWLSAELIDPVIFRRFYWILPVPAAMAVAFLVPSRIPRIDHRLGLLVSFALLLLYAAMVPTKTTLEYPTRLGFSRTKTGPAPYGAARLLAEHAPAGSSALAPFEVATWVSTFHHHPPLFFSRKVYQRFLAAQLGKEEAAHRAEIVREFTRRPPLARDETRLRDLFRRYDVGAYCYMGSEDPSKEGPKRTVRRLLWSCGFEYVGRSAQFHCWVRSDRTTRGPSSED